MNKVFLSLVIMLGMVGCSSYHEDGPDIVVSSYVLKFIVEKIVPEDISVSIVSDKNISDASTAKLVMYVDKDYDGTLSEVSNAIEIYPLLYSKQESPVFWVSPKQMITASEVVYSQILNNFPEDKDELENNYTSLFEELRGIDQQFTSLSNNLEDKNIAIYKNTFEHLTDYGYNYIYLEGANNIDNLNKNNTKNIMCSKEAECSYDKLGINETYNIVELNMVNKKPIDGTYFSAQYKNVIILENSLK